MKWGNSMWVLIGFFVWHFVGRAVRSIEKGDGGGGGAKEAEWEGKGVAGYRVGIRYVLGHTCSLSNPVTLIFLPNTQMSVRTSAFMHTHTHTLACTQTDTQRE